MSIEHKTSYNSPEIRFGEIKELTQSHESSCVPTAVSMALSGFNIDFSEEDLINGYFPGARLPASEPGSGSPREETVPRIVKVIEDLGLENKLQIDVLAYALYEYVVSQDKWLVQVTPKGISRFIHKHRDYPDTSFETSLLQLMKEMKIRVYSLSGKTFKRYLSTNNSNSPSNYSELYEELLSFLRLGHSIGLRGGFTCHATAIDGANSQDECKVVDPRGNIFYQSIDSFFHLDQFDCSFRHGAFDVIVRISPKVPCVKTSENLFDQIRRVVARK